MKKILLLLLPVLFASSVAMACDAGNPCPSEYHSTPPTYINGWSNPLQTDVNGKLLISGSFTANASTASVPTGYLVGASTVTVSTTSALPIQQTISTSITDTIVTVSNSAATLVDSSPMSGRLIIKVQNIDATANLWCQPTNAVTSGNGEKLIPSAWFSWNLPSSVSNIWCISDGGSSTKAVVTQAK